ncbi:MAG: hypothetical protein HY220_00200 [Candidatus Sungbacteria bacterium]|uniref:Uncharacterized protein n=1 Tax=Candidatus Sungiibacteriota bacterium TaxID=2750080 RepID=A0A9D6QV90_9BACT|nr:hypothetical protein [Candidatus Sungbacteria bacterium]
MATRCQALLLLALDPRERGWQKVGSDFLVRVIAGRGDIWFRHIPADRESRAHFLENTFSQLCLLRHEEHQEVLTAESVSVWRCYYCRPPVITVLKKAGEGERLLGETGLKEFARECESRFAPAGR